MDWKRIAKIEEIKNPVYFHNKIITFLISQGKKSKALLFYFHFIKLIKIKEYSEKNTYPNVNLIINKAIYNVMPLFTLKKKIFKRKILEYPYLLSKNNSYFKAIKWLILSAKEQKQKTLLLGLVKEFIDSASGKGFACKKKIELYDNIKKNKHLYRIKKKKW